MRLHRLELEGFGPFRDRQTVDFDAFAGDGIFLIAGRTGAGKSSVLDGICFALYGGVPRYDGGERRLRSDHCAPEDQTRVVVEFSAAGRRWRVTRSPEHERPKQRGTGLTVEPHRAQLDELVDDQWIGRAARPVDVARELDEILGLSQQQFLQVILLAQNRFAEFLLAKSDDRQRLLRRLFGTRTYEEYQTALEQRRKVAEHDLAAAGEGVRLLLAEAERILAPGAPEGGASADVGARLEAAALGVQRARYRVETLGVERSAADAQLQAAEAALAATRELRERQERRALSRQALTALETSTAAIDEARRTLEQSIAAESLRAPIDAAVAAERGARAAGEEADAARAALRLSSPADADADAGALRALVDELTGALAVWTDAAERERALQKRDRAAAAQRARAAEIEGLLAPIDAQRALLPERLAALAADLESLGVAAAAIPSAEAALESVRGRLAAARETRRLAAALTAAESAYLEAGARHDGVRTEVTGLLRRRLAGHAGELAAALVEGEPCSVCGSVEHPSPAPAGDDVVTDDEIAQAEARRDRAADAEAAAAATARSARDVHAVAAAKAGGGGVEELEDETGAAESALRTAQDAAARRDVVAAERAALMAADAEAESERERLAAELSELTAALATAEGEARADRAAVDAARGEFASVADRIAAAAGRRSRSVALLEALVAHDAAESAARTSAADLERRVRASVFDDPRDAAAALRDADDRDALDRRIRDHDAALRAERDRLRELELALAGEPEELADPTAAEALRAMARERWTGVVDAAAAASETASRLADLVSRASSAQDGLADLAAEHAVIARLADTVAGRAPNLRRMTLESFVLAAELEEIVGAANLRLHDMSQGRYRLLHTDALAARGAASGLGLEIMDAHTGQPRPAQSLSGGETFLASLSLALGLAEVVTARAGGVRLDTLFIDEGFGSLDEETLELAMLTLDELRQGGRTVGLISHVPGMKDRLPAQLVVEATPQGPSAIRQGVDVPA